MDQEKLTLATIKDGALVEQFDIALQKVIANIADINTSLSERELTLVVKIKPNNDRSFLAIAAGVKTKLAGQEKIEVTADLKFDDRGRPAAWTRPGRQMEIPFDNEKATDLRQVN